MKRIYLDNAATTPILSEVAEHMSVLLREEFGNPSSIHQPGRKARTIIEDARKLIAGHLGASIGEIFFTSCATESNNQCLKMAVFELNIERIISSPLEHHCVKHTVEHLSQYVETILLEVDETGKINLNQLKELCEDKSKKTLVSLMFANNEIGNINPIENISEICKENEVLFHCDAVQAVGKFPIDVNDIYFSFLSGTAHKFHGPKGISFVYINGDNIISPLLHGGAQERNMRSGTENVYGISGMAMAFDKCIQNMDKRKEHILMLRDRLKSGLSAEISDMQFNGFQEDGHFLYTVLSASFPQHKKSDLLHFNLDIAGICASAGSACSSGVENDSHVLEAIGHDPNRKTIRFSFSHYNTVEDIDFTINTLSKLYQS